MYPEFLSSNYNSAVAFSLSIDMCAACGFCAVGECQARCPRVKAPGSFAM